MTSMRHVKNEIHVVDLKAIFCTLLCYLNLIVPFKFRNSAIFGYFWSFLTTQYGQQWLVSLIICAHWNNSPKSSDKIQSMICRCLSRLYIPPRYHYALGWTFRLQSTISINIKILKFSKFLSWNDFLEV